MADDMVKYHLRLSAGGFKELPLLAAPKRLKASQNCSSSVRIGQLKTGEMSLIVILYY